MMNPEPSELTLRDAFPCPRKSLNRSASGEPGGRLGTCPLPEGFRLWVVAILTTMGSSLAERSANESGAPRAIAAEESVKAENSKATKPVRKRIAQPMKPERESEG